MNKIYNFLARLPAYVRNFGFCNGVILICKSEINFNVGLKSRKIQKYYLPNYERSIYLRSCISDHAIFWQCLVKNQYEFKQYPQYERLISEYTRLVEAGKTPLIIDCGGNIGLASFWYANRFPDAKIVVVEPDDENLEVLKLNLNYFSDRVMILKGGVWNKKGFLKISNPDSGPAAYRVEFVGEESNGDIQCYTIEEICKIANSDNPMIVKIDIEGAQKNLFESNTDWVRRTNFIALELDDWLLPWQGTSRNFFSCLSQYPFDYLLNGESIFCFRDFFCEK